MKKTARTGQYKNEMMDLIITSKTSNKKLEFALTKLYVPWCDKSRKSLTATLKCPPVPPDDNEDYGPVFFKVGGYQKDGSFDLISVLFWRERIIMCRTIDFSEGRINFRLADIYERTSKQCKCSNCAQENYEWKTSGNSADVVVSLEQKIIAAIQAACDHWDELFSQGEDGVLRLHGGAKIKALGFEQIENKMYGREWSGVDYEDPITHVSLIWPFQFSF